MDRNSLKDLILEIKRRPSVYLTTNTIHAFASFIDGWMMRDEENVSDKRILEEYNEWVQENFHQRSERAWYNVLLFYSNDEVSALKLFFETFDKFLEERESKLIRPD